ncbi:hypothetical protein [Methylogaea oryzae]|uniref:Uncharacterized protein n=1 Tax=Methylogaea oryzae TaxID=1295382 RepID=A0A8D4VPG5_9GAMM|nr:hypothetical protein [Methylogaea oryzae]BBL71993.1 hypothetical protein MoryE10_25990 [Methylogaea oryzae]
MIGKKYKVPAELWEKLAPGKSHHTYVGDIQLKDGTVYRTFYFDFTGEILGEVVGGQDGISMANVDFDDREIVAVRRFRKADLEDRSARHSRFYMFYRRIYGFFRKWRCRLLRKRR